MKNTSLKRQIKNKKRKKTPAALHRAANRAVKFIQESSVHCDKNIAGDLITLAMRREPSPDISDDAVQSDRPTTPFCRPSCIEKASDEVRESVQGDIMIHPQISAQEAFRSAEVLSPVELSFQYRSVVGTIPSTTQELTASQIGRKFPESLPGHVNFNRLGKDERRIEWTAFRLQEWREYNQANAGSFTNINNWLLKKPVHVEEFLKEKVDQFLAKTHKVVCVVQIGQP